MRQRQRMLKCAVLAALFVLGGACTKINAPAANARQTHEAVMAAASAADNTTISTTETTANTTAAVTTTTTVTTTITTTTTTTTTTAPGLCAPFIDESANIDPNKPMVALTFDDGPGQYTNSILDTLSAYNAHATFFVVGQNIDEETGAVMQRAVGMGCEIGSHSYRHANLGKMDQAAQQADQAAADALFQEVLGTTPALLRPPYGSMNKTLKTTSGRSIVTWSIDTEDWRSKDADKVVTGVENAGNLDGQVILLHSIYESTVAATEVLVPWLLEQGYQLVTVSELIQLRFGDQVEPNRTYNYDYFRFQVPPLPAETAPAAA